MNLHSRILRAPSTVGTRGAAFLLAPSVAMALLLALAVLLPLNALAAEAPGIETGVPASAAATDDPLLVSAPGADAPADEAGTTPGGFTAAGWAPEAGWPQPAVHVLLVSNSPETVREPGIALQAALEPHTRYRLFVHHVNATGSPAPLKVTLEAAGPAGAPPSPPVRARTAVAGSGRSPQPFASGWAAASAYAESAAPWVMHRLPPDEELDVWTTYLDPGHVATGYVLVETDGPALLRVRLGDGDRLLPPDGVHMRGTVADPQMEQTIAFSMSQRVLDVPFGASGAFRDRESGSPLRGDYGVDYRLTLTAHNPFDVPMPLYLLFIPRGGDGRLLAVVDGQVHTTPRTFSGHYYQVRRWVIQPQRTRTISIWTTPVAAMGYPAVLRFSTHLDAGWPRHPTSP